MGNLNHTDRAYVRRASKQIMSNRAHLQNFVEAFLTDCFKKSEDEIREIYKKYELMWVDNCAIHNSKHMNINVADKNKVVTLLADSFEDGIANGHIFVKNLKDAMTGDRATPEQKFQYKEFVRTFDIFKKRSKFQKLCHYLGKHFFVKGTYTKYKTGNDKPTTTGGLTVVK